MLTLRLEGVYLSVQKCIDFLHSRGFASDKEYHNISKKIKKWDKREKKTGIRSDAEVRALIRKHGKDEFGTYLRLQRNLKFMSIKDLSETVNIPHTTINQWELGMRNPNSESRIKRIAEYFNDNHFIELTKHLKLGD
jgi:ribosome-binding protein aMBF1 (putative translation factor)